MEEIFDETNFLTQYHVNLKLYNDSREMTLELADETDKMSPKSDDETTNSDTKYNVVQERFKKYGGIIKLIYRTAELYLKREE